LADLPIEKLQNLAQQLGLDMEKFNSSLLTGKYSALVDQEDADGRALGVNATPIFLSTELRRMEPVTCRI